MQLMTKYPRHKKLKIIGLMSGTSCDGVDLALIETEGSGPDVRYTLQQQFHQAYTDLQKETLLHLLEPGKADAKALSQINFYLAGLWSEAIEKFLKMEKISPEQIDLIGSHGQTIYHQPAPEKFIDRSITSTLQLGDPAVLAQLTGITTIGDFRVADVAVGGQGAPLVPFIDWMLFSRFKKNLLVVNIGGIANFTFIPASGNKEAVMAFDTGPGNMLIDQLMQRLYEQSYDENGAKARLGQFSQRLFDFLIKTDPYPQTPPPKSTGREHYGKNFVITLLKKAFRWRIQEPDIIHTVSRYTAYTIWQAYDQYIQKPLDAVYVGGGGSRNPFLMETLAEYFGSIPVGETGAMGMDADFKEAISFALLANELIRGNTGNLPGVTGALRPVFLGKICPA